MRATGLVALASALLLVAACDTTPSEPGELSPVVAAAPGNGNGGGPGGGGGDGGGANTIQFADRLGDGVYSDNGTPYEDGSQRVGLTLDSKGQMIFLTKEKGKTIERRLCHDVSSPQTVGSSADLQDFETEGSALGSLSDLCANVRVQTKRHAWGGSLLDMAVGQTDQAAGTIYLHEVGADNQDSWEWRLQFATDGDVMDAEGRLGEGLCITRDSETQWTVRVGGEVCGGAVDDVLELWRVNDGKTFVASYVMPLEWVLTLP